MCCMITLVGESGKPNKRTKGNTKRDTLMVPGVGVGGGEQVTGSRAHLSQ